jgi:hypothetical protein
MQVKTRAFGQPGVAVRRPTEPATLVCRDQLRPNRQANLVKPSALQRSLPTP